MPVVRNSCVGSATMQETRSASTSWRADVALAGLDFEDIEPLAITTPAVPPGASLEMMCWIQA